SSATPCWCADASNRPGSTARRRIARPCPPATRQLTGGEDAIRVESSFDTRSQGKSTGLHCLHGRKCTERFRCEQQSSVGISRAAHGEDFLSQQAELVEDALIDCTGIRAF